MRSVRVTAASAAAILSVLSAPAFAQEAPEPGADQLPPVEVIQEQPAPAPAAKKKAAAKKQVSPAPQGPAPAVVGVPTGPGPERGPDGRVISGSPSISPVDPSSGILPTDLQNYAGGATRITTEQIEERRPKDNHELLSRVPGVVVINDDGMSRHSGIGMRGSPVRRSRKILVMEDGLPVNFSPYLDASTHYTPPVHRLESVEVMRGMVVQHGPLNNHGVVNFRNLNPFGPDETVITAAIGHTDGVNKDIGNYRHVHTRQSTGNAGIVASYTGSETGGAWDNEVLRYNDFHGAIGLRGSEQDIKVSGGYFRQRDTYDESNFTGTEADFYRYGRTKPNRPGSGFAFNEHTSGDQTNLNQFNADYYRVQATHNWYIDPYSTLSTRVYYSDHDRERPHSRAGGPDNGGHMRSRDRHYRFYGVDSRFESTEIAAVAGVTFDFQAGIRFERHNFHNCNTAGYAGEHLSASNPGECRPQNIPLPGLATGTALSKFEADSFAAFIQAPIHLMSNLTVTPGVRFENYEITGRDVFAANYLDPATNTAKSKHDHVLPGIGFAWEALQNSTVYGSYHQGITPLIVRDPDGGVTTTFPLPDEKGDNYQIGFRSTAMRGLTLDLAYFHSDIDNYQIKGAVSDPLFGNTVYGMVDEVEINGFEIYSRLDSQPFTGGPLNFFGETTYTYSNSEIKKGQDFNDVDTVDVAGNHVPEVPRHFASLTLGVQEKGLWSASVTGSYIGSFFTDARNTGGWTCISEEGSPAGIDQATCLDGGGEAAEGTLGKVDGQWLLSARADYQIPDSNMTLFVSGQNLTNEFYLADHSNGAKPGLGRTLWAGFSLKLDD